MLKRKWSRVQQYLIKFGFGIFFSGRSLIQQMYSYKDEQDMVPTLEQSYQSCTFKPLILI